MKHPHPWWFRTAVWTVVLMLLAAVFASYTRPDFMLRVANQIWSCF